MKIVIGETTNRGSSAQYAPDFENMAVEARVLEIRDARHRGDHVEGRESAEPGGQGSAHIVVLLVPEGYKIPKGLESGSYRTFLRFVKRGTGR